MTSLIESIVEKIAPHRCICCSNGNNILCFSCFNDTFTFKSASCVVCYQPALDSWLCAKCAQNKAIERIWIASEYDKIAGEVVKRYKFDSARAARYVLADAINIQLPVLSSDTVIVPIPTIALHIRQRGFDHMSLIAKELSKSSKLTRVQGLGRLNNQSQVGADRKTRIQQAGRAFYLKDQTRITGRPILIIDDVVTTGSTLFAAAKLLKKAGAGPIYAAAVAWQPLKK